MVILLKNVYLLSFWCRKSKTKFMNYNHFIKKHVVKHKNSTLLLLIL